MHRLFVALRPPAAIRDALLALTSGVAGARWQDDEQLHVTLRFIGEADRHVAEDIDSALATIACTMPPLALAGVGRFDTRGRTTTLWAGVVPAEPLAHLHRKIDAALVRAGLPPERRAFTPHITLARLNAPEEATASWLRDHGSLRSKPFAIDSFLLFESHLGRAGARYEAIARYPLRPPCGSVSRA